MPEIQATLPSLSPRDLLAVVFKRKTPILVCYGAIVLVAVLFSFFWPPTYEAGVRFLVKHDREDPIITADQQSVRTLSRAAVTEEDLNSEMAILQSRAVLENTVRDLRLDRAGEHWAVRLLRLPGTGVAALYNLYHHKQGASPFGAAVARLGRSLGVTAEKRSAVLDVRLRWGDANAAVAILEQVSKNYRAQHVAVRREPEIQSFFLAQAARKKVELEAIEDAIQKIRPGANLDVVVLERDLALKESDQFESEWRKALTQEAELRARIGGYDRALGVTPDRIVAEEKPSDALAQLQQKIVELELHQRELLQKYQPTHPLVTRNEQRLLETRALLSETRSDLYSARTSTVNPISASLGQGAATDRAQLEGIAALSRATVGQWDAYRAKAASLEREGLEIARLERDRHAAEDSYLSYVRRYEEARVEDAMNRDLLVNVAAIEPVRAGASPVKPNAKLILKLALALGLLLSLGLGFALELLDHRVRSEFDIERHFGIPVLATFERREVLQAAGIGSGGGKRSGNGNGNGNGAKSPGGTNGHGGPGDHA